jgi:uncharacterized damage-inducible protein DinB
MANATIRPAFSKWPEYNRRLRDIVAAMTEEQLAMRPSPERWPLWATVGHTACQRVFWLCDFAGEPGAETTPFTNAGYNCPGDDDLEHVFSAAALAEALDATFRIVENCLDQWTLEILEEELRRPEWDESWVHTRGAVLQRVFSHDVYHCGEINERLGIAGLPQIDLWD